MDRGERERLRSVVPAVAQWSREATRVRAQRDQAENAGREALGELRSRAVQIRVDGSNLGLVVPIHGDDRRLVADVWTRVSMPAISEPDVRMLDSLTGPAVDALAAVAPELGWRRHWIGGEVRRRAARAASFLFEVHQWGQSADVRGRLERLVPRPAAAATVGLESLTAPRAGVANALGASGSRVHWLNSREEIELPEVLARLRHRLDDARRAEDAARAAARRSIDEQVHAVVDGMPLERLRDVTSERLVTTPLKTYGISSVGDLLRTGARVADLPGIGPASAQRLVGAASALLDEARRTTPARINADRRDQVSLDLVGRLLEWDDAVARIGSHDDAALVQAFADLGDASRGAAGLLVIAPDEGAAAIRDGLARLARMADRGGSSAGGRHARRDAWTDFVSRPADYQTCSPGSVSAQPQNAFTATCPRISSRRSAACPCERSCSRARSGGIRASRRSSGSSRAGSSSETRWVSARRSRRSPCSPTCVRAATSTS